MAEREEMVAGFGDLDGEVPRAATIRITGSGWADRGLSRGERVAITLVGDVVGVAFKNVDGVLTRIHTVKADSMAEATDTLADTVAEFLAQVEDAREGRLPLPLGDGGEEE